MHSISNNNVFAFPKRCAMTSTLNKFWLTNQPKQMRNIFDTDQNPSPKQLSFIPEYNGHTLFHNKNEPQNKTNTFQQS